MADDASGLTRRRKTPTGSRGNAASKIIIDVQTGLQLHATSLKLKPHSHEGPDTTTLKHSDLSTRGLGRPLSAEQTQARARARTRPVRSGGAGDSSTPPPCQSSGLSNSTNAPTRLSSRAQALEASLRASLRAGDPPPAFSCRAMSFPGQAKYDDLYAELLGARHGAFDEWGVGGGGGGVVWGACSRLRRVCGLDTSALVEYALGLAVLLFTFSSPLFIPLKYPILFSFVAVLWVLLAKNRATAAVAVAGGRASGGDRAERGEPHGEPHGERHGEGAAHEVAANAVTVATAVCIIVATLILFALPPLATPPPASTLQSLGVGGTSPLVNGSYFISTGVMCAVVIAGIAYVRLAPPPHPPPPLLPPPPSSPGAFTFDTYTGAHKPSYLGPRARPFAHSRHHTTPGTHTTTGGGRRRPLQSLTPVTPSN